MITPNQVDFLFFDLRSFKIVSDWEKISSCWVLFRGDGPVESRLSNGFIFSLPEHHRQAKLWLNQGLATTLKQAGSFFQSIRDGRTAVTIAAKLVEHLNQLQALDCNQGFEREIVVFSEILQTGLPAKGLNAFLKKDTNPFTLSVRQEDQLDQVLRWLREAEASAGN